MATFFWGPSFVKGCLKLQIVVYSVGGGADEGGEERGCGERDVRRGSPSGLDRRRRKTRRGGRRRPGSFRNRGIFLPPLGRPPPSIVREEPRGCPGEQLARGYPWIRTRGYMYGEASTPDGTTLHPLLKRVAPTHPCYLVSPSPSIRSTQGRSSVTACKHIVRKSVRGFTGGCF